MIIKYLGALIYDLIILLALCFALTAVILLFRQGQAIPPETLWYQLALLVQALIYYFTSIKFGGQTIGMRAWGIRV